MADWTIETVDDEEDNVNASLAIDSEGTPHIVYGKVLDSGEPVIKYAKRIAGSWSFQTVPEVETLSYARPRITLAADDTPYIATYMYDNDFHPVVFKLSAEVWSQVYKKALGGNAGDFAFVTGPNGWGLLEDDPLMNNTKRYHIQSGEGGIIGNPPRGYNCGYNFNSLAIGSDGKYHAVGIVWNYTSPPPAFWYSKWNGSLVSEDLGLSIYYECAITLDSNDIPHVAYAANTTKFLTYAKRGVAGGWTVETLNSNITANIPAIRVDSTGKVHIVCAEFTGPGPSATRPISLAYYKQTASGWDVTYLDTVSATFSNFLYLNLELFDDLPYIFYTRQPDASTYIVKYAFIDVTPWPDEWPSEPPDDWPPEWPLPPYGWPPVPPSTWDPPPYLPPPGDWPVPVWDELGDPVYLDRTTAPNLSVVHSDWPVRTPATPEKWLQESGSTIRLWPTPNRAGFVTIDGYYVPETYAAGGGIAVSFLPAVLKRAEALARTARPNVARNLAAAKILNKQWESEIEEIRRSKRGT